MKSSTIQAITSDSTLTEGARMVLVVLFSFASADGRCWPGNEKLRTVLGGMPEPTLNRHLAKLREAGAVEANYDRQTRRRTFTVNVQRYACAPITSDSCTKSAPITSDSCTYHQREVHLSPVIAAPITSDRPNKNRSENRPLNRPAERAGGIEIQDSDSEPFVPTPDPDTERRVAAQDAIFTAAVREFGDRGARWAGTYGHEYHSDPDGCVKAIEEARIAERGGATIRSVGGFIRSKYDAMKAGPGLRAYQPTEKPRHFRDDEYINFDNLGTTA
jgi:DNA-binding transcriptional ArsR family regulator